MASRIVGIDLGTTNSLVGVIERGGPRLFEADGSPLVPSVLSLDEKGLWLVGAEAKRRKSTHPDRTLFSVKRFLGRGSRDVAGECPFDLSASDEHLVRFRVADKTLSPVEASAKILQKLKAIAEAGLGEKVERAVVTVPAYFDDAQRQATKLAGELAGLEVVRIVNEPTAACLAYGLDKRTLGTIAVFDLGGGTFDISILRVKDGVFEVLATHGDTALGGDDFDRAILDGLGVRVDTPALVAAETLKKALTTAERATFDAAGVKREVTRAELEAWLEPVLRRTEAPCRQCLADAGVGHDGVTDVILVGGSTRTPRVARFVQELFRREPICTLDPDRVVAMGAAVQANILAGQTTGMLLLDVIPLSLGLETMGGVVSKLVHRNSTIPVSASEQFSTYVDGQTAVDLHVVQGEREMVKDNRSLARFQLRGLPPLPAGVPKIDVEFIVDANGILSVRAIELRTGTTASITVNPTYGLGDTEVEKMLSDSFEHAESDFETRFLTEARVEADALVRAAKKSLERGRQLVDKTEADAIATAIAALEASLAATDRKVIRAAIDALNDTTRNLAERLMNHAVSEALKNKTLTPEKRDGR